MLLEGESCKCLLRKRFLNVCGRFWGLPLFLIPDAVLAATIPMSGSVAFRPKVALPFFNLNSAVEIHAAEYFGHKGHKVHKDSQEIRNY